ncbi:amino acid ABC transporter permease [Metasolibacillus sp.]|uniref:amino acid ABC transporter permease n=1 Tax=Metasolibacillus sp. TaxID=2703680 RepID=UPI0025F8FF89|nr:amino acid ABC transporter permease [Metasolibacillus sp.]MCT6925910.1 amino acid ABC transporter permease [Metasolibacillus sp.]MCT6942169.1 amino acid ABC transporter permease [Metasolibacillus sp.]
MQFETVLVMLQNNWPMFLRGAYMTIAIAIISTIIGAFIGLFIGIMHTIPMKSKSWSLKTILLKIINFILTCYVEVFRGTPMIVQAMVVFYGLAAYGIELNRFVAALVVVGLNTGAYMAEIVRGGIVSVDKGQYEAAQAIGMNHVKTMVFVILPQVIRNILPATGNQLVMNIKDSAVLSVISVTELFFQTKSIGGASFKYAEAFLIASVMYLILTFTATRILRLIERKIDGPDAYQVDKEREGQVQ